MVDAARKLQLKAGQRVVVLNAPSAPEALLGSPPEGAQYILEGGSADAVVAFARESAELRTLLDAGSRAAAGDRLFWVCYPKGGSGVKTDLKRDSVAAIAREFPLQAVSQVAIDETWSALRLRPAERYQTGR